MASLYLYDLKIDLFKPFYYKCNFLLTDRVSSQLWLNLILVIKFELIGVLYRFRILIQYNKGSLVDLKIFALQFI